MNSVLSRVFRQPLGLTTFWLYRVLAAWLLAAPLVTVFAGTGLDRSLSGDRGLFEAGGFMLIETLRLAGPGLVAQSRNASLTALGLFYCALVPLGVLLIALRTTKPLPRREWVGTSLAYLPRLSLWLGFTLASGLLVLLLAALVTTPLATVLDRSLDRRTADLAHLALWVPAVLALALLGVTHDLGRAIVVCEDQRFVQSLKKALSVVASRGGRLLLVWLGGATFAGLVVLLAAAATSALEVERPEAWRWLTALLLHQAVVFLLVLLRGTWFAYVALVSERHPSPTRPEGATPEAPDPLHPRALDDQAGALV